jgi:S1-C subfamily serine protease
MRTMARVFLAAAVLAAPCAQARADPAAATVMIRVVGEVKAALGADARAWRPSIEIPEVQIGTGSGFIVSPSGYILTNSHVIRGERLRITSEGRTIDITVAVRRILIVLPLANGEPGPPPTFEAAVVAEDPELDLAVLSIGGQDLPCLQLGDAGVMQRGDPVTAWGYPLGDRLTAETSQGGEAPPVSAASGTVAALREGGAPGLPPAVRYIQITAPLNPGNSGGPLTDRDGYVVGIVQAKVRQAEGVGFAISIEEIKQFLERTGIDAMLPVTRLTLGPVFEFAGKGLRLRVPAGFADASGSRLRVDSGDSLARVRLLVDRLATSWDLARVERALLDGRTFGHDALESASDRPRTWPQDPRLRVGLARPIAAAADTRVMYAIADLGSEKVVARYDAPAGDLAFNLSVLRESLLSLEVAPLATGPLATPLGTRMAPMGGLPSASPVALVPDHSIVEAVAPGGCPGLPPAAEAIVATPERDFTVRFVATWWPRGTSLEDVMQACLGADGTRVTQRLQYLGLAWVVERRVVGGRQGEPVLMELWAPDAKVRLAMDAFLAWTRAAP